MGYIKHPVLKITKAADPASVSHGGTIDYTTTLQHDPASDGSPISNVVVSDDVCSPLSSPTGDDGDNLLEASETWSYTCSYSVSATHPDPEEAGGQITNTAEAEGQDRPRCTPCTMGPASSSQAFSFRQAYRLLQSLSLPQGTAPDTMSMEPWPTSTCWSLWASSRSWSTAFGRSIRV